MILSNEGIHQALDAGDVAIDPEPEPRRPVEQRSCPYDTCSVNLRLGALISIPKKGRPITLDLRRGGVAGFLHELYETVPLDAAGGYALPPTSSSWDRRSSAYPSPSGRAALATRPGSKDVARLHGSDFSFTSPHRPFTRVLPGLLR
jgi:hypothetical protein